MTLQLAKSDNAKKALQLVSEIQDYFVNALANAQEKLSNSTEFLRHEWLREKGQYGGGNRIELPSSGLFNRGSVNVSQVHYPEKLGKRLASATALSTIIHPSNPFAPSVHMHISWTEMHEGKSYWRLMADLNPSINNQQDKDFFRQTLRKSAPQWFEEAEKQGDKYFFIPALERCRGTSHFYLENFNSGDPQADQELARNLGKSVINTYVNILVNQNQSHPAPTLADYSAQLAYHTLYFFQVLTLDRGTTAGLLIHDENDVGILASLPAFVDRDLLISWISRMTKPQDHLLEGILSVLPEHDRIEITEDIKISLAKEIRNFYQKFPEALNLQATGDQTPDTVGNHKK